MRTAQSTLDAVVDNDSKNFHDGSNYFTETEVGFHRKSKMKQETEADYGIYRNKKCIQMLACKNCIQIFACDGSDYMDKMHASYTFRTVAHQVPGVRRVEQVQ